MTTGALNQAELYDIVVRYSGFGNHHTGSAADINTTDWLVELLTGLGADVEREPFIFQQFDAAFSLVDGDGVAVPAVPLFYSGVDGRGQQAAAKEVFTDVDVIAVPPQVVGSAPRLSAVLADLLASGQLRGDALAISIEGPPDEPVWCNRIPGDLFHRPTVIVPGNWHERLAGTGGSELRFSARLTPGESQNLLATFGSPDADPVRLTTPLTGWTPAAGERGTGMAVAISMALDLSRDHRVELSICSGHELDHAGLRHHLERRPASGAPVIHLGASVGAVATGVDGDLELGRNRMLLTTITEPVTRSSLAASAAAGNWTLNDPEGDWPGEGGTWKEAGASVLSFLGSFPLFHVASDTVERATTPEHLVQASDAAIETTRLYLDALRT